VKEGLRVEEILAEIREGVQDTRVRVARIEERQSSVIEHVRHLNGVVSTHAEAIARLDERAASHGEAVKELRSVAIRWGAGLAAAVSGLFELLRGTGGPGPGKHP